MYYLISNKDGVSYGYDESKENLENYILLVQDYIRQTLNDLSISLQDVYFFINMVDNVDLYENEDITAYKATLPVNYSLIYIYSEWFIEDFKIDVESAVRRYFYDYTIKKGQTLELNGRLITPNPEIVIDDNFISLMIDDMISFDEGNNVRKLLINEDNIIKSIKVDGKDYVLSYFYSDIDFSLIEAYEAILRPNSKCSLFINSQPKIIREELMRKAIKVLKKDYDGMVLLISELNRRREFDEKFKTFKNNY